MRTTTILLAAIGLLLALNLIATTAPAADTDAPATANGPPDPYIVKLLAVSASNYHRVWSDGRVDAFSSPGVCDFTLSFSYGPVEHTFPVVDANYANGAIGCGVGCPIMLTYEDGRIDLISVPDDVLRCTLDGIGTPALCIGDVDRSGTVGIEDFLIVLQQWGEPCQ